MKIKKVSSKPTDPTLAEAAIDLGQNYSSSVYADHDKLEKIRDRKTDVARAMESARAAKARAQKAGNEEAVKKLDDLISQLQAWFDGTKGDIRSDSSAQNNGEGGESNGQNQEQELGQEPDKPKEPKRPEEPKEPKKQKEEQPGTEGSEEPEEGEDAGEEEPEEPEEPNDQGQGDEDADEQIEEPTDGDGPIDEPTGPDQPAPEKKPGEEGEDEDGEDQSEGGENAEEDEEGEGGEDQDGEDQDDQEDSQEDDGPRDNTPKIKDNKIQVDPFSKKIGTDQQLPEIIKKAITDGKLEIEGEWEAFKRIVSGLKGDAREGAKKAISDYMRDSHGIDLDLGEAFSSVKGMSLSEAMAKLQAMMYEEWTAPGSIETLSDSEFNNNIRRIISEINRIMPEAKIELEDEDKVRHGIEAVHSDEGHDLDTEDALNKQAAKSTARAKEDEIKKYSTKADSLPGMSTFRSRILRAMSDQVALADEEEETYSVPHRRSEEDPAVLRKGTRESPKFSTKPNIEVYCDCSGSWDYEDLKHAFDALSVLNKMVQEDLIEVNVLYFANHVHYDYEQAREENGTTAWREIISNIVAHKTKNVVLITDGDMSYQAKNQAQPVYVQGCVWFLWKDTRTPEIVAKLRGRGGVSEFNLLG